MREATLRMRDVCARTGLARSTIHHYIREGLLPKPVKTSRNTALYDEEFVRRARLVRALQEKTHLPLSAIRETLSGMPDATLESIDPERFTSVAKAIAHEIQLASERELSRSEMRAATGLSEPELDGLTAAKLITPIRRNGAVAYSPLDARIAAAIAQIREAGATLERGFGGSAQIVRAYRKHLTELARTEAREMLRLTRPLAELDVENFTQRILDPLGDLVAALHRKALVEAIAELTNGGNDGHPRG